MDSLAIDRLWHTTDYLDELREISRSVQNSGLVSDSDIPQGVVEKRTEIKAIVEAIESYRVEDYQKAVDALKGVSNRSLNKHRLLGATYNKLYGLATRRNSPGDTARYQALILHHTEQYANLASRANKTTIIANNNLAIALMRRDNPGDLDAAHKLLNDARREAPNNVIVIYNLAAYYVKIKNFEKAIEELQNCKSRSEKFLSLVNRM